MTLPPPHKGRGATSAHLSERCALPAREAEGDWLDVQGLVDGPVDKLWTSVTLEAARTILTRNTSPDIPFDRSINAYRGCEQLRGSCVKPQWRKHGGEPTL